MYNDALADWTAEQGLQLVNYTPGTRSNADYSWSAMGTHYLSSDSIIRRIFSYETQFVSALNGHILLFHLGTDPRRKDKLYRQLGKLLSALMKQGYRFVRIDQLPGIDSPDAVSGGRP